MAELPRYQSGNIQYADLPRISTAVLEEQASGARFMSEKIGQLTSFAFKKAGEQAVEEAKKFAAENPVTQAQIDAAKQDKNVVEKFLGAFTGKGGVMYQNALSEAQGILLSNNLQVEATKTFNDLLKKAELGQIGFEDARLEINDMVDGYMASVTAFNPDAAYQMKAALATRGNSVLTKVGDFETNRIQAALKSDFLTSMSDGEVDLTSLYASQATSIVLDSGQQISRADAAQLILNPLQNTAIGLGDEKMIGDIVQMNRNAMIAGMANAEGYGNDVALLNALRSGVMIEGHQGTWDQLTNEERNDAMKLVMERIKAVNDQEDQMQKQYRRVLERRRGQIQRDVRDRGELMPQSEIDMLVGEMQDANIITDGEDIFSQQFIDMVKNRTFMNDIATDEQIAVFRQGVRDGDITPEVTDSLMRQGWLGGKQKADLDDLYSVVSKFDTRNNIKVIQRKIDGLDIPQYHKKVLKDKAIARFTDLLMGDPEGVVTQDVHAQAAMDFATKGFNENQIKEGKRQLTEQYAESLAKGYIDPEFASMDPNLLLENLMSGAIDPNMIFLNPDERRIKDRINALMRIVNQIKDYQ